MPRHITQREYAEAALERKRRKLLLLQQETGALEQMVELLRRTDELAVIEDDGRREWEDA